MADTSPKRSKFQIERDRQQIADWYCQGLTQAVIAERINADEEREYTLTQQMISYDLKQVQKAWLKSALRDFDEARAQELAKIDRLEREYWRGWERSCENAETVVTKSKGVVKQYKDEARGKLMTERPAEVNQTSKGQAGDPRFLAGVERCIERRCKLLGLDAPEKREVTGKDGGPLLIQRVAGFDDV